MKCLNFANLNCVIWCQDHWAVSYWSGQASRLHATEADGTVRAPSYDTNRNECDARFGCLWWHMMLFLLQTTTRCGLSPNHILISETSRLQVKVPPKLRGAATLWVGCSEFVEHGAFGYGPFLSIPTLWSCTWMRCVHHHHDCVLSQWPAAGMFASTPNLDALWRSCWSTRSTKSSVIFSARDARAQPFPLSFSCSWLPGTSGPNVQWLAVVAMQSGTPLRIHHQTAQSLSITFGLNFYFLYSIVIRRYTQKLWFCRSNSLSVAFKKLMSIRP